MKMRDIMDLVESTEEPGEPQFFLREVERGDGVWRWQYGYTGANGRVHWNANTFKSAAGAVTAAQRILMNPNHRKNYGSEFFRKPVIFDRLPITNRKNPFCLD